MPLSRAMSHNLFKEICAATVAVRWADTSSVCACAKSRDLYICHELCSHLYREVRDSRFCPPSGHGIYRDGLSLPPSLPPLSLLLHHCNCTIILFHSGDRNSNNYTVTQLCFSNETMYIYKACMFTQIIDCCTGSHPILIPDKPTHGKKILCIS